MPNWVLRGARSGPCCDHVQTVARNTWYGYGRVQTSKQASLTPRATKRSCHSLLCCYLLARLARCHTNTTSPCPRMAERRLVSLASTACHRPVSDCIHGAPRCLLLNPYNSSLTASPAFCADSRARLVACVAPSLTASVPFSAW